MLIDDRVVRIHRSRTSCCRQLPAGKEGSRYCTLMARHQNKTANPYVI